MSLLWGLWAAEAWAAAGAEHQAAPFSHIIYPLINFLLFVYLIKRLLVPAMRGYLSERRERVASAVKEAAGQRARAEAMVRQYRGRLERLENEAKELSEMLRREGERLRARLVAEGEELAAKIKADVDFLAEQEMKAGRQQLRVELASLAREKAAALLSRDLSAEDQRRLVQEFADGLGQIR